jgi:hypothetical protein
LLPGGAIQFPGGPFFPLWSSAFHGALLTPGYINQHGCDWVFQRLPSSRQNFVKLAIISGQFCDV